MPPDEPTKTTETTTPPAKETPPAAPALDMLKTLGYFTEPAEQEQVPNEEAGEAAAEETPPAGDEAKPGDEAPLTEKGDDVPDKDKPASIPTDKRATKVKPSDQLEKPVSKEDITAAVTEALRKKDDPGAPDPLAKYGELLPHERRALEIATFAAEEMPAKYKDMVAKEVAWIARNREYIQKVIEEHGEFTAEHSQSDDYRDKVLRHRPAYQPGDKDDLLIARGVRKGVDEAEKRFRAELAERDRKLAAIETAPKIERVLRAVEDDILSVLDKPLAEAIKADPKKAAAEAEGLEAPLAIAIINDTQHNAREYLALAGKVREFNKDDPTHAKLVDFIQYQGKALESTPEEKRQRDGKTLVSRERWATIPKEQRAAYTTFTDGDIIDMLAVAGRNYLTATIKAEHARLEKAGYVRRGAPAKTETPPAEKKETPAGEKKIEAPVAAKPAAKPAASSPPKGGATAAPGAAGAGGPPKKAAVNPIVAALGYG